MSLLSNLKAKIHKATHPGSPSIKIGDVVVSFSADGCMAHDHNFTWIGRISSIEECGTECVVNAQVFKFENRDVRDSNWLHPPEISLWTSQLRNLEGNIWMVFT